MIENIHSPEDVKALSQKELKLLAEEMRTTIIDAVQKNGGHLASNLGTVEATIILHKIFNSPQDKIIFDVGHQSYAHKLLTGRYETFDTLRSFGGVSGFPNREESEHDAFTEGHSGASLSAALGVALANRLQGKEDYVVCVVGDGALTNGMIYEALNNCTEKNLRLIILINDNDMSISKNIGGIHNYFSRLRTSRRYFKLKHFFQRFSNIPLLGKPLAAFFRGVKNFFKRIFVKNNLFEDLGIDYIGPVDGHDMRRLLSVLTEAKRKKKCSIVHMITKKGKGYAPAEEEPEKYHSVSCCQSESFSDYAGRLAVGAAEEDERICAITAAMRDGVGLSEFSERFPERFFDVGIAEEHSVTFAGGLSANGMKPVLFLYSTFAQRGYDQLLHDISIQKLPLVLMLDRCGIVSGDGVTHQGIFDYAFLSSIPNATVYSPATYQELETCFHRALSSATLTVVRYPKGEEAKVCLPLIEQEDYSYTEGVERADVVIVTYGRMTEVALKATELYKGRRIGVIKLLKIFPLNIDEIVRLTGRARLIYCLEEGYKEGSVSEKLAAGFSERGAKAQFYIHAIEEFVSHGSKNALFKSLDFTPQAVIERISKIK